MNLGRLRKYSQHGWNSVFARCLWMILHTKKWTKRCLRASYSTQKQVLVKRALLPMNLLAGREKRISTDPNVCNERGERCAVCFSLLSSSLLLWKCWGKGTTLEEKSFNCVEEGKNLQPRPAIVLLILRKSKIPCSSVHLKWYLSFTFLFTNANK